MPFPNKWGSEFHIPAGKSINLRIAYSAASTYWGATCVRALQFQPIAGRDYQIFPYLGGSGGVFKPDVSCALDFADVTTERGSDKMAVSQVPIKPLIVKGSPAWASECKDVSDD